MEMLKFHLNLLSQYQTSLKDLQEVHSIVHKKRVSVQEKSGAIRAAFHKLAAASEVVIAFMGVAPSVVAHNLPNSSLADIKPQKEIEVVKKAYDNRNHVGDWADQKQKKSEEDAANDAFEASKANDARGGVSPHS